MKYSVCSPKAGAGNCWKVCWALTLWVFHTHDYRTYFLRSALRILGLQSRMGVVQYNNRLVRAEIPFPWA
jgi:hypothetical protein